MRVYVCVCVLFVCVVFTFEVCIVGFVYLCIVLFNVTVSYHALIHTHSTIIPFLVYFFCPPYLLPFFLSLSLCVFFFF